MEIILIGLVILAFFASQIILLDTMPAQAMVLANIAPNVLMLGLAWSWVVKGPSLIALHNSKGSPASKLLKPACMTFAMFIALKVLFADGESYVKRDVMSVAIFTLLAPCAEELFFRGYVLNYLWRGVGVVPAIFISSALFTVLHSPGSGMLLLFSFSGLLACVTVVTKSLNWAVIFHIMWNSYIELPRIESLQARAILTAVVLIVIVRLCVKNAKTMRGVL
ncbi:CPBP family intramembrane metalloprotease [Candidatus Sumerlaeota bacterium]|nr:CPBP family intramembrane metalloprotease [Candidatus Sumerlaeota bacterium]